MLDLLRFTAKNHAAPFVRQKPISFEQAKVALHSFVTQLGRQILSIQRKYLPQRTSTVRLLTPLPSQSQFSQPLVARDLALSVHEDDKQSDYQVQVR